MANAKKTVDINEQVNLINEFDLMTDAQSSALEGIALRVSSMFRSDDAHKAEIENNENVVADELRAVLKSQGDVITYGWFEAVRLAFGDEYRAVRTGASDDAIKMAWSRAFKCVTTLYSDVEKPSSISASAVAKRDERVKKDEARQVQYADFDVVELQDKAKSLYNSAVTDKKAKKQADEIVKVIELRTKVQRDELTANVKHFKTQIALALKKVDDCSVLEEVLLMLEGAVFDAENLL
jgi:hypothetical protein